MKFKLIGRGTSNMTSLQGHVSATYDEMVEAFGEPHYDTPSGDGKVNTEWELEFFDPSFSTYVVATIYDWKDFDGGRRSRDGSPYDWHIGGHRRSAVDAVESVLKQTAIQKEFEEDFA